MAKQFNYERIIDDPDYEAQRIAYLEREWAEHDEADLTQDERLIDKEGGDEI